MDDYKQVLITGGSGKLGTELLKVYPQAYAPSHKEMDITNEDSVVDFIEDHDKIDLVIHTAAMTDTQKCETEWRTADRVNIDGTYEVGIASDMFNAKMVYISTACVFDGENAPFDEDSKPLPKNYYALTKLIGERMVQRISEEHLIIRTNFVANEPWRYPAAFTDRFGSYLFASDVARGIKTVIDKKMTGIVHVCGYQKMSMYDLAKMTTPHVKEMTLADYHGCCALTQDMTLISKRIAPFRIGVA